MQISSKIKSQYSLEYSKRLEKLILENLANDFKINFDKTEVNLDCLETSLQFLYGIYLYTCKHLKITSEVEQILKKYCLKVGFMDNNIDELNEYLLKNAQLNTPFKKILEELSE